MCVVLLSMTAQAQEKGDFALGVHAGATFSKIEFMGEKDSNTTFGIGAFGQYNFANKWRLELEANYHPMQDHVSDILLGLNVHYLINVAENFSWVQACSSTSVATTSYPVSTNISLACSVTDMCSWSA